jgi:glycosyltransferase involved in cell wall biosynthesis
MRSPRVSVVVTCYNLGAYLPETLESIRAQTFGDFEICVVDDGSNDVETQRVLRTLASPIAVIHTENRGLPAARNLGVARTSGEYVCAVDGDDILAPTLLERSVARLDAEWTLAFVSHWLEAFGDESWVWKPKRCDFPSLLELNTVNGSALVRRTALQAVGGWDEAMRDGCEDWDLWITLVARGFRGEIIPEVLFRYRRRPESMSRVKFADGGLARLYRGLVEKHANAFAPYLNELSIRREADTAANRALADDLEERLDLELIPAIARARDDLATAERRRALWTEERRAGEEARQLREETDSLRGETNALHTELDALTARLAVVDEHARHLERVHQRAVQEIAALRGSLSWRLTEPLRSMGALVNRIAGRRP